MILFRLIAFLEGVSYILLLFVAVPIKYILGLEIYVKMLGMSHGLLFSTYIIFVFYYSVKKFWSFKAFLLMIFASIMPFGTFYIDQKYLKNYANRLL